MSDLADALREMIATDGPMPLDRYMALALGHPQHGYYITRDPFGAAGDFVTSPEISQMFGELLGLWAAEFWNAMGSPARLRLVELGPGRGTLMADLLRVARIVPEFQSALDVHLVESSPVLEQAQRARLAASGFEVTWHREIATLPRGPLIVIANEFFDALPVRHYVQTPVGWRERLVAVDPQQRFVFTLANEPERTLRTPAAQGTVLELGLVAQQIASDLAKRIAEDGGGALIIDYGHATTTFGETLQALRAHQFVSPLETPGEADITVHVDFAALARAGEAAGAQVFGPVPQGTFLHRLGIDERTTTLMSQATPGQAAAIESAYQRLTAMGEREMGALFKVMALTQPGLSAPAGFEGDEV
jgi:NADH dehydrogenase [ubiquinone] 1 alpha subcomplex assembly factor 7